MATLVRAIVQLIPDRWLLPRARPCLPRTLHCQPLAGPHRTAPSTLAAISWPPLGHHPAHIRQLPNQRLHVAYINAPSRSSSVACSTLKNAVTSMLPYRRQPLPGVGGSSTSAAAGNRLWVPDDCSSRWSPVTPSLADAVTPPLVAPLELPAAARRCQTASCRAFERLPDAHVDAEPRCVQRQCLSHYPARILTRPHRTSFQLA